MKAAAESIAAQPSRVDELEAVIRASGGVIELPLNHIFTPGLYVREVMLPKGSISISKIHKTTHPFVISHGSVSVWTKDGGIVQLSAPHTGITTPGTQRVIYAHEDTIWSTFHPTNETDLEKIEADIIQPHTNPLLADEVMRQLKEPKA